MALGWAFLLPALALGGSEGQNPSSGATQLERLREDWASHRSLIIHFTQVQRFAGFEDSLASRGTLRILRPSFFEIVFDPPNRQRQVCDGSFVWTYMEDQKQVFKAPLAPEATRSADLLDWALSGATALAYQPDPSFRPGAYRLDLKPGAQLSLRELRVWIRGDTGELFGYEAVDAEGNRSRMRIKDMRPGDGLQPSYFHFVPPEGVELIDMEGNR